MYDRKDLTLVMFEQGVVFGLKRGEKDYDIVHNSSGLDLIVKDGKIDISQYINTEIDREEIFEDDDDVERLNSIFKWINENTIGEKMKMATIEEIENFISKKSKLC